jgi:AAA+ superfamily predicted ATPase
MPLTDTTHDIALLVRSRHGLIGIATDDDARVATLLRLVADRLSAPFFIWTRTRGLRRDGSDNAVYGTDDFAQLCAHIAGARIPALYLLRGVAPLLDEPLHAARLADAAESAAAADASIVLGGDGAALPSALQRIVTTVALPDPDAREYRALVERVLRDLSGRVAVRVELEPADAQRLVRALTGLSLIEAEKVLTRAIVEDGVLSSEDIRHVLAAKRRIIEREGVLEFYPTEESLAEVADLTGLKTWLAKRRGIIRDPKAAAEFGLTFPKGILLVGVPGCGKSLCARAVAADWGLPLLRLDTGTLYNKYIGESERNFRRACAAAERLAPVVLFIDELEKAFATGGGEDGGVTQRVLGNFLSWLQDRRGDVFTVATANDVSRLPPEFLRKGRFDEIFFVDLPDAEARAAIFRIHLRRRNRAPEEFAIDALVAATAGFSGAEIEQVIVAALYTAFAAGQPLGNAHLQKEIGATRPLSHTMAERVAALRQWAVERTVPAN